MGSDTPPSSAPPQPYRILVACALDETTDWALLEGLRIHAARSDCELHVVHAVEDAQNLAAADALQATELRLGKAPELLRARIERMWDAGETRPVVAHVHPGRAVPVILQTAVDVGANLIVVGTHRRSGIQRFVQKSVAGHVLRQARCPVLVARPTDYRGATLSARIAPLCDACAEVRERTQGDTQWCERHARAHVPANVYIPRPDGRSSVMQTY